MHFLCFSLFISIAASNLSWKGSQLIERAINDTERRESTEFDQLGCDHTERHVAALTIHHTPLTPLR